jgi:hypothetical protein
VAPEPEHVGPLAEQQVWRLVRVVAAGSHAEVRQVAPHAAHWQTSFHKGGDSGNTTSGGVTHHHAAAPRADPGTPEEG